MYHQLNFHIAFRLALQLKVIIYSFSKFTNMLDTNALVLQNEGY